MMPFELLAPRSQTEVLEILRDGDEDTRLLAGGTGLLNMMKRRLANPTRLVSLHNVETLDSLDADADGIIIGANHRLLDVENHRSVAERFPALVATLAEVAGPRIRAMATLGGAVAQGDPSQDTPVTLMALDARVNLLSATNERALELADFYHDYFETDVQPDELVTSVTIPNLPAATHMHFTKFTPTSAEDYACVDVCVRLTVIDGICSDSRIVLGAVGPTTFRARAAETMINGEPMSEALAREAAEAAARETDPIDDTRGSARYKRQMSAVMTRRALLTAAA